MKFSTRGLKTYILVKTASATTVPIPAVTSAKPAVAAALSANTGSVVKITGTGWASIDGRVFEVGAGGSLLGSDTTNEATAAQAGSAAEFDACHRLRRLLHQLAEPRRACRRNHLGGDVL